MTLPRARVPYRTVTSPSDDERRIKLTLHYDGTDFHGWQVQPEVRTVQGELERALSRLTDRPTAALAAGRTDSGVHATGQVMSALVPAKWTAPALRKSLNAVLPRDVWVATAEEVSASFNARLDAVARRYVYRIGTVDATNSPFRRRWCWPVHGHLEASALADAAARLPGDRSFRAFAKAGQPERGDRCIVRRAAWSAWDRGGHIFDITANRFLHHMVRYLVGTMVDIALGRRPASDIDALLAGEADVRTSPPAPPEGLFLVTVYYDDEGLERESAIDEDLP